MHRNSILVLIAVLLGTIGCGARRTKQQAQLPRPVKVETLYRQMPPASKLVSASVGSWKTEEIGFEVSGRVQWVAEPTTAIEGRIEAVAEPTLSVDGRMIERDVDKPLVEGTPIAKLEDERFWLQVRIAEAEVSRAQQNVAAATVELNSSLPAQLRAAEAEKNFAEIELARQKRLDQLQAGAQADIDRANAAFESAVAMTEQLQASIKSKAAELESLKLQITQAQQSLSDARRNFQDCTLYSSFRGQIAKTAVVPGSVVTAGQPVATVQMMDPVKIELEVSAEDSRRLRQRQNINVFVTGADGAVEPQEGFLYLIDPLADPTTRTFTVTVLMRNRRAGEPISDAKSAAIDSAGLNGTTLPVTDQAWPVDFSFLPGAEQGMLFAPRDAIHQDDQGSFVWRVDNMTKGQLLPPDRLFKVSKVRVELPGLEIPFLGNWVFKQVLFKDDSFDPSKHVVAGKLTVSEGDPDDWEGDTILVDRGGQWMVRPGDVVKVDLSRDDVSPGFYVPMDAISRTAGKTYLFVIESSESGSIARQTEIVIDNEIDVATSSLRRIRPVGDPRSLEGKQYVTQGAHYLRDGEQVKAVLPAEAAQ